MIICRLSLTLKIWPIFLKCNFYLCFFRNLIYFNLIYSFRDELSRFIADKRCLTSLKMEGCYNLGGFAFSSTSLSCLWLSDLHSLSKMVLALFMFISSLFSYQIASSN